MSIIQSNTATSKSFTANEIFKGHPTAIAKEFILIRVMIETNHPGTLRIFHSTNISNWAIYGDIYEVTENKTFDILCKGRYFYIQYTNGATPGVINITTMLDHRPLKSYTDNKQGRKGNIHSGNLAPGASTLHFNCHEYGINSVLCYEDTYMSADKTVTIFTTSSETDQAGQEVSLGVITPVRNTSTGKRYISTKINLAPFEYIWIKSDNDETSTNAVVSVFSF